MTELSSPRISPASSSDRVDPRAAYQQRLDQLAERLETLSRRDLRFVRVRTALFVVFVGIVILCAGEAGRVSWWWLLVPVVGFVAVLPFHQRLVFRLEAVRAARRFHAGRLERLNRQFADDVDDGREFLTEDHPWAHDLDVFGRGSLFHLMNECRTQPGRQQLAAWLSTVADGPTIRVRQARAQGLKNELTLREELACVSDTADWKHAAKLLDHWVRQPAEPMPWWIVGWSATVGIVAVPVLVLVSLDLLRLSFLLLILLFQAPAIALTQRQIRRTAVMMDQADAALRQFGQVISVFEKHSVDEPTVRDLQNRFHTESETASHAIHRLSRLTALQNNAIRNQFFAPIAWACGLFVLLTHRLECWRARHGKDVSDWLVTAATLEATVSVAGYSFDHPHDVLPEISDYEPELIAEELGHPLLRDDVCVRNSVTLSATAPLLLVSGSNMSGKSTFLRSIGCGVVLTLCGSVIRAKRFRTYPFQLATAMRASDSLQEGRSLFFSVVRRLKSVVDLSSSPRVVLFLLDEILHGTNSNDRRQGAEAVIRTLVQRGAMGLVTTHDLALTKIVDTLPGQAVNKHFEDSIADGKMTFDYRLRDGVVERSNAIALMRMMGLDV